MSNETLDAALAKPGLFSWYKEISRKQWLAFVAAFLGWTLDAMDLLLYVYALPKIRDTWALTDTQAGWLFGVTLASSALGGALFGIISDYIGRIRALTYSILMYSVFTGLSAFAPNVEFFLICRFFLGLGMGGEWASGEILVAESWPREHRGKVIGMVQSGWGIGYIMAATIAISILPYADFEVTIPYFGDVFIHSWRVLFLVGVLPAFLVFFVRRHCEEPEIWKTTAEMRKARKLSEKSQSFTFVQLWREDLIGFTIRAVLLTSFCMIAYWGLNTWVPTYLASPVEKGGAGLGLIKGYTWTIFINIGAFIGCNTFGAISDRLGRRPTFVGYLVIMAILVPIFGSITEIQKIIGFIRVEILLLIIGPLLGFFGTGFYSGFGAIMAEVFPTRARGTAQGFCYNFGRGASALAPAIFAGVAGMTIAGHKLGYGFSLITASIFAVLAAITVLTFPETKGKKLEIE
ncbi:MAG TPA: MFS transporter [Thermodesulfobacteriota bacterium]|jgi:MFS family permease|nr:MFS transporter [Thermodesulfobacteriota bacterium]